MSGLFGGGRDRGAEERARQSEMQNQAAMARMAQENKDALAAQQASFDQAQAQQAAELAAQEKKDALNSRKPAGGFYGAGNNATALNPGGGPRSTFLKGGA